MMTFPEALRDQAISCSALGSPFMGRLLNGLADHMSRDSALYRKIETWPAPLGPSHASLPLRLAGGLHHLVLTDADEALSGVYPPNEVEDAQLMQTCIDALERHSERLLDWIERPPQTNEVRRSVALVPAAHHIAAQFPLPFVVSELGASGGINLMFDRYGLTAGETRLGAAQPVLTFAPDWSGPVPAAVPFEIAARRGVDLTPLDLQNPDEVTRLLAYLWPDQPDRRSMTLQAVQSLEAEVDTGDAVDWLAHRLETPHPGHVHVIYHTVAWQYFPSDVQARGEALIDAAGSRATKAAPLARVSMEADDAGRGAGLHLQVWPDGDRRQLARIDFHGRWIEWTG
ncbi:MAG: DUF2332 family protein [Pseudomonadota bacterium]